LLKIKICGITNSEDAGLASMLGADYIGLNFCKESPRKVSLQNASKIFDALPPFTTAVGVFVDEPMVDIKKIIKKVGFEIIQLHGSESQDYCLELKALGVKVIKAFRVNSKETIDNAKKYLECSDYFLFDSFSEGVAGGTGEVFDLDLILGAKELGKPFFLAGGLTPENVAQAIEKVHPFAVDVASGVERLPSRKDFEKMKLFVKAVRSIK